MESFYTKVDMPKRIYSKSIKINKFLNNNKQFTSVTHDLQAAQSINIKNSFPSLFNYIKSKNKKVNIIEIGTFRGGLTLIIDTYAKLYDLEYTFNTYDIKDDLVKDETKLLFESLNIKFNLLDVFSSFGNNHIKNIINQDSICLIFCDGGNKAKEINKFSNYIKRGDIILGHDYGYDANSFSKKEWTAFELSFNMIENTFLNNKFKFLFKNEMEESVWFCGEKQL